MYHTESLDGNVECDLHRTHLNNANKLTSILASVPGGISTGAAGLGLG